MSEIAVIPYKRIDVRSLGDFFHEIKSIHKKEDESLYFRGHSKSTYKLEPSVFRTPILAANENKLLLSIMAESPKEFAEDKFTFDKLVRAQHYGIKTRVLDLTSNPLVALYFACSHNPKEPGEVICLQTNTEKVKFFNSDVVSCLSNLCYLTTLERQEIAALLNRLFQKYNFTREELKEIIEAERVDRGAKWESLISDFNAERVVRRLIQFIREEKPHFEPRLDPIDLYKRIIVLPKKNNLRITAQRGAFVIFGFNQFIPDQIPGLTRTHFVIDSSEKESIVADLDLMGISEHTVYPELDRLAKGISERYSVGP